MIQVSGGYYHSAALTVNRHVYTWGWGEHGQLGHGVPKDELVPRCVEKLIELTEDRDEVVREVHCGGLHTLAVTGTFSFPSALQPSLYFAFLTLLSSNVWTSLYC